MSEGSTDDEKLFSLHPEFQNGVEFVKNTISWSQYGYAISERKFKDGIWKINIKFDEVPAIAWFGILKCDDDKFEKGNVHDRAGLCVYHSNGFCNQSGFSYGNSPWKSEDKVTLEINLTSPAKSAYSYVVSAPPPSYLLYNPPHPFVVSAPSPSYLDARASLTSSSSSLISASSSSSTSKTSTSHPYVVSAPSPSYLAAHPSSSTRPTHPFVVSAPSPSYLAAHHSSSEQPSSNSKLSLPSSSSYDPSSAPPTYNTLHFYVNDELQPVSYVNIPTPLRFIVYCNYGESKCEVLGIEEVEKDKGTYNLLQKEGDDALKAVEIYDPDEKGIYMPRVVSWNTNWKRDDR